MKMTHCIIFLSLLIISNLSIAQSTSDHLFIEIDVTDQNRDIVRYGRIVYEEDFTPNREYFEGRQAKDMFLDTLANSLSLMPVEKRNTLLYIHGMWAYKWSFLKGNHKKMQTDMWAHNSNPNGMVITVIWHCKVNYFENKEMALKSGKILSPLIRRIHDVTTMASSTSETNYIIHSMGHRVFEAIWENHLEEGMQYKAGHIVMAGSDLESNAFEDGEVLGNIEYFSDEILLYVHNNDRTLGMSKMLNKKDRLGLEGIADLDKVSSNILQVDVSVINDNEDAASKFSNHRYYYMSPTIRKDIALFYQGVSKEKMPRRKNLNHSNRYMLEMPAEN